MDEVSTTLDWVLRLGTGGSAVGLVLILIRFYSSSQTGAVDAYQQQNAIYALENKELRSDIARLNGQIAERDKQIRELTRRLDRCEMRLENLDHEAGN